jgi:transcription elongation factor GreA
MPQDVHITPEGLEEVRRELDQLVKHRRPEISSKIKAARELGDLSENFEYHAAKNEQGFIEARIAELEAIVKNHVLIDRPTAGGAVQLGSTVRFTEEDGPEEAYRIVGPAESDPKAGKVSNESSIGRALLGRKVGEEVKVETPNGGSYRIRITAVE